MREKKTNIFRDPLDVVFRLVSPEAVIDSIKMGSDCAQKVDVTGMDRTLFDHCAQADMGDLTADEVELIWKMTRQNMYANSGSLSEQHEQQTEPLIFHLLSNFSRDILKNRQDDPIYEITAALRWRDISHRLGQDLFTTAHYAWQDVNSGFNRTYFAWPLVLHSNDRRIRKLMENGSAENHFHLEGSVPTFHLSWVCLMNHPEDAFRFERKYEQIARLFRHNLQPFKQFSAGEQQLKWSERLSMAAWIRAMLFQCLEGIGEEPALKRCFQRLRENEITREKNEINREENEKKWERNLFHLVQSYCGPEEQRHSYDLLHSGADSAWREQFLCQMIQNRIASPNLERLFLQFVEDRLGESREKLLRQMVQRLRGDYGNRELVYNRQLWCVDYADTTKDQRNLNLNNLLVGERYFLYRCLRECFLGKEGRFGRAEQNLFYLYLLIKERLRSELIQVNNRPGFRNFAYYQDRKSGIWRQYPEYREYAYRIAVNQTIRDCHLSSLEVRISPQETPEELADYIYRVDRTWLETQERMDVPPDTARMSPIPGWVEQPRPDCAAVPRTDRLRPMTRPEIRSIMAQRKSAAENGKAQAPDFFYVLHFTKSPLPDIPDDYEVTDLLVRHHAIRNKVQRQALSIAKALEMDPYLCTRIRGIDAAAAEIGCRPENFATEFRFLYKYTVPSSPLSWHNARSRPKPLLGMTYHVGEDFQTVEDGLRAIDEAVCFLNLERGSRLGHALAVGVDPELHYRWKSIHTLERKQDRLDNLVWLMFRSAEWSVSIPSDLRVRMTYQAESLLHELYGHVKDESVLELRDYYEAWKLRGDHPDIIRARQYGVEDVREHIDSQMMEQYHASKKNHYFRSVDIASERGNTKIQIQLAYAYLYDRKTRIRGQKVEPAVIDLPYMKLIRDMQKQMLCQLNSRGIAIESNPSSNLLIGSIDRYDIHPVFQFNSDGLPRNTPSERQMNVSINTDDQGVFATSLENEYALLANAMYRMKDENGERLYSDQCVLYYLEHLQRMGKHQVFPASK